MLRRVEITVIVCLVIALGGPLRTTPAQVEANKDVMRRASDFWNTGDMTIADEVYAADFVNHDPTAPDVRDLETYKAYAAGARVGMPDFHVTSDDMVGEGDKVASRWTVTGTQTAELAGIPPTDRQATWTGITIYRFADGKVVEAWWSKDTQGMLEQLGVMPPSRPTYTWGEPSPITGDPGDPATNKASVQRMIEEVMNQQNMGVVDELFAADYVMHDPAWPMEVRGPEGFKQWAGAMLEPYFSDSHITAEMIAEGDKVAVPWTWTGTHTGEFMGMAPTGNQITVTGTSIHRFANGKFVESWASYDGLGMIQQLTAPPTWPIEGAWTTSIPIPDAGIIIGLWTVVPQDREGLTFTSMIRAAKPEATIFGAFPEADHESDHIGQTVWTGSGAYESTWIGYGTKTAETPGQLPEIVYISVLSGKAQFADRDTIKGVGTHAFYLGSQDADGDGWPEEDEEPVACFPYASTGRRVRLMPPCVPPPPESE